MSLRGRVTSLLTRVLLTYCAAMVTGGVLVIAFMMLLSAGLSGSGVASSLMPLVPVVGIALAMLGAHVMGLGWGTGLGIVLMPLPLLALGTLDLPSQVTTAAAFFLPLLVALALHPHDLGRPRR